MRTGIICILIFLLLPVCSNLFARNSDKALMDSLASELPKQKEDTNKVKMLTALAFGFWSVNPDEGIRYGLQGLELATRLGWEKGIARANSSLATIYCYAKSDFPKALKYSMKSAQLYEQLQDKTGFVKANYTIGTIYFQQGNYPKALEYCLVNIRIHEELGDTAGMLRVISQTSLIYYKQQAYAKALEYDLKALKMAELIGDKIARASISGNMGLVYNSQGDNIKSLEYFLKALTLYEELNNRQGIAINTNHIGGIYHTNRDYPRALEYMQRSLKLSEELGLKQGIAENASMIGSVYLDMINDTALKLSKRTSNNGYSIPLGKQELLNAAIKTLELGLAIARENGMLSIVSDCYKHLAIAVEMKGDYRTALKYTNSYIATRDSVFSNETDKKIMTLEFNNKQMLDSVKTEAKEKLATEKLQKQKNYTYIGFAGILLLVGFSFFIIRERGKSEKERMRSDKLLLNILPSEVAEELKANGETTAKLFDDVTVLFTDFVNFTYISQTMTPQELINELHECFKVFDEITGRYKIEKIKTIGDAYLAVAGLPVADPNHAQNIVRAAQEITCFMNERIARRGQKTFGIRVGIHSGSLVAGIVGVKKFAYDIWGDTVNTAARMEQNSEPGHINISQTTYELVKDSFTCEYRGEIDAKGKGMLKMYYVV